MTRAPLRILGGFPLALALAAVAPAGPELVFEKERHDFGPVVVPGRATHGLAFENAGDAPLRIDRVRTSCGCTVAELPKSIYGPGESGRLEVTMSVTHAGTLEKSVYVDSNDPAGRRTLVVRAEGTRVFRLEPEMPALGELAVTRESERVVTVASVDGEPFTIGAAQVATGDQPVEAWAGAEPVTGAGAAATWRVRVTARPGRYLEHPAPLVVRLETDRPDQPVVEMPLAWSVRPPLRLAPADGQRFLGVVRPGQTRDLRLVLESDDPAPAALGGLDATGDAFTVTETGSAGEEGPRVVRVRLAVPENAAEGFIWTRLDAETGRDDQPTVSARLSAHVVHRETGS